MYCTIRQEDRISADSTLFCSVVLYSILPYTSLFCSTLFYSTVSILLYSTLRYSTLFYFTLLYITLFCSALLYSTVPLLRHITPRQEDFQLARTLPRGCRLLSPKGSKNIVIFSDDVIINWVHLQSVYSCSVYNVQVFIHIIWILVIYTHAVNVSMYEYMRHTCFTRLYVIFELVNCLQESVNQFWRRGGSMVAHLTAMQQSRVWIRLLPSQRQVKSISRQTLWIPRSATTYDRTVYRAASKGRHRYICMTA
jgi:hypothetical protein